MKTTTLQSKQQNTLTLGFIGLGLIGGSIAKTARRVFPDCQILAYDPDLDTLHQSHKEGIVTTPLDGICQSFEVCDYIFLCSPTHYNILYLSELKHIISDTCILTDVGSVKTDIYEEVAKLGLENQFIGGHPMVGSEKSGYTASKDRLIENAYYFLTPSKHTPKPFVHQLFSLLEQLGALPIEFSPEYHDFVTATISHVPHVVASCLVQLARGNDTEDGILKKLAAGGFKDITRIASSSPTVWQHILLSNPHNIVNQLSLFQEKLENVKQAILEKNEKMLYDFFNDAKEYRNSLPDGGVGPIHQSYEIYVDVADQAGILAIVTTILGSHSISIKNIGIIHSREYEEGALKIAFYEETASLQAIKILEKYNFTVYKR